MRPLGFDTLPDKPKVKRKPPKDVDMTWFYEYWRKRDMVLLQDMFVHEETKKAIKLKYGL